MKFKDTKYGDLSGTVYKGDIDVSGLGLTSLEGSPKVVNGLFECNDNDLTSLKYSPEEVGSFICNDNDLTSLEYLPRKITNSFYYFGNNIKHSDEEFEVRRDNPTLSEDEIKEKMYEKTNDDIYLSQDVKDIFIF